MSPFDARFVEAVCADHPMGLAFYIAANSSVLHGWRRRMALAALDVLAEREEAVRVLGGGSARHPLALSPLTLARTERW